MLSTASLAFSTDVRTPSAFPGRALRAWDLAKSLMLALAVFMLATTAQAQRVSAEDAAATRDQVMVDTLKAIRQDLQDIKVQLAARPAAPAPTAAPSGPKQVVSLDLSNRPFRGAKDAPVTIVEITDYECPFCGRHATQTLPQIDKEYIATGKVKYYVIDLPLESIHRDAFKSALAVRCANEQGKYWEMHDRLFANQATLNQWTAHANAIGIDADKFKACVDSDKYIGDVRKDVELTQTFGVRGTPGFYLASGSGATLKTTAFVNGARPFAMMKEQIDALLQ